MIFNLDKFLEKYFLFNDEELMNTTANKLKKINDEEFLTLDLENTLNETFVDKVD